MRTTLILASAAFASAVVITAPALADDRLNLTPPLYREQAHATRQVRSVGDLTTTPQPVLVPVIRNQTVSMNDRPMIQAAVTARR